MKKSLINSIAAILVLSATAALAVIFSRRLHEMSGVPFTKLWSAIQAYA